ncbi:MAG: sodium:solute symporter [Bacteroidales bacterium]|jgi:Na+/proline symporter|nr:sodium:solute symporter [Bacteroidales bacterium]
MNPTLILSVIAAYFLVLLGISYFTTRKVDSQSFYNGNRRSPWYIIAIAMLGTSISGVTFVSVPGMVVNDGFAYMQMVFGFVFGYVAVALILLPVFYKLNLTSIYTYLENRFGMRSYKTGAAFFLLSRTLGSAFRLYIVAIVLQKAVFDAWNVPFLITVSVTILLIFLYTRKGGIKTVIWTDTIQTLVFLAAVVLCIYEVKDAMNLDFSGLFKAIADSDLSKIYVDDVSNNRYFWKQFLAGVFTVVTMTGLDQDQMQKNLSCKSLKDAQKNMFTYGALFVPINLVFLSLGVLLVTYAKQLGFDLSTIKGDELFPILATHIDAISGELYLGTLVSVLFILGIISAAYSSADSALTALTTSFTVDILGVKNDDPKLVKKRTWVHISIAIVLIFVIELFHLINNESVINSIYTVAGYTYGPLLGLFAFGLFTKLSVKDRYIPIVAVLSPVVSYGLNTYVFDFGFSILIVNGALCFLGLWGLRLRIKN